MAKDYKLPRFHIEPYGFSYDTRGYSKVCDAGGPLTIALPNNLAQFVCNALNQYDEANNG